jgi:hypothetical protein
MSQSQFNYICTLINDDFRPLCNRGFLYFLGKNLFVFVSRALNHSIAAIELRKLSSSKEIFWQFFLFISQSLFDRITRI